MTFYMWLIDKKKIIKLSPLKMRRSSRLTQNAERESKELEFQRKVRDWSEDGLVQVDAGSKGRGVAATKEFAVGDYVTCYRGELITHNEAIRR